MELNRESTQIGILPFPYCLAQNSVVAAKRVGLQLVVVIDHFGTYQIEVYVANQFKQIGIFLKK
jgi:hypothetical protein